MVTCNGHALARLIVNTDSEEDSCTPQTLMVLEACMLRLAFLKQRKIPAHAYSRQRVQDELLPDSLPCIALAGKLQRLEEERQMHVEQISAQDSTLEDMDRQGRAAQAQADSALQSFKEVGTRLTLSMSRLDSGQNTQIWLV